MLLLRSLQSFRTFYQLTYKTVYAWRFAFNFARGQLRSRWSYNVALALTAFSFERFGVTDEELSLKEGSSQNAPEHIQERWELVHDSPDSKVHRRKIDREGRLYEYKCSGSYSDISPASFIEAQMDVNYRKLWDDNVIRLEILEEDEESDSQLVKWVAKFPYPMYPRLYIYVSRRVYDYDKQEIAIVNKAVGSREYPSGEKYVRIHKYGSKMVVRAHSSFLEKGLDYTLTYYEDSHSAIPSMVYNYMINRLGPHFLQRVHTAAKVLESHPRPQCYTTPHAKKTGEASEAQPTSETSGNE